MGEASYTADGGRGVFHRTQRYSSLNLGELHALA